MNKKTLLFFLAVIFSLTVYAENIEIYLTATGNFNGNYERLGIMESRLKNSEKYYARSLGY